MSNQFSYGGGAPAPPQQSYQQQGGQSYYPPPPQMQGSAPYHNNNQQQQQPYKYNGNGFSSGDSKMPLAPANFEGERFQPKKPKFRDPIFALFFLAVFAGFIALSVISLRSYSISNVPGGLNGSGIGRTLNYHTAILLMLSCAVALGLSIIYIFLVKTFTRAILEVTLALSVIINIAYCVLLWVRGFTSAAIIFTIFAVFSVIAYFFMRKRIPLTKLFLLAIIRASNEYKSAYVTALVGLLVQTAFSVWWAWTLVATYQRFTPNAAAAGSSASSGAVTGLVVFLVFAFYYISEVLKNVWFTTVAGIYGVWYYNESPKKVSGAALSSFRRASTYSLGSIAFGSLITAILDILRAIVNVIQRQQAAEGDLVGTIIACIAGCCLSFLDWAISYFNHYAYISIALYGNSYIQAAKETWRLLMDRGLTALVNDVLVNIVFTIGSYIIAVLTALFAYVYLRQSDPSYAQTDSGYYSVIVLYAFGLGINIALTLGSGSIGSGVSTLFVGLAEDPHLLAQKDPQLFSAIQAQYPRIVNPVA